MARIRTFLALDLGAKIRKKLVAVQEELAEAMAEVKWVEPDNLHVTLLFLGEVNDRELPGVCRAAQQAVAEMPSFTVSVETLGCFPNTRRPRVVWAGIGQGMQEICRIHDALESAMLEQGCYRREERQFTPHVTLGRVRSEEVNERFAPAIQEHRVWSAGEVAVNEVLVMSSQITRHTPSYSVLSRAKLLRSSGA
jgi:2'-5' RNA ligase